MKSLQYRHYTGTYKYDNKKPTREEEIEERYNLTKALERMGIVFWKLVVINKYFWIVLSLVAINAFIDDISWTYFYYMITILFITVIVYKFGYLLDTINELNIGMIRRLQKKQYRRNKMNLYSKSVSTITCFKLAKILEELGHYTVYAKSSSDVHVDHKNRQYEVINLQPIEVMLFFNKDNLRYEKGYVRIGVTSDVESLEKLTDAVNISLDKAGFENLKVSEFERTRGVSVIEYTIKDNTQTDAFNFVKGEVA